MKETNITMADACREMRKLMERIEPNKKAFSEVSEKIMKQARYELNRARVLSEIFSKFAYMNNHMSLDRLGVVIVEFYDEQEEFKYIEESTDEQINQDLNNYSPEPLHIDEIHRWTGSITGVKHAKLTISLGDGIN